MNLEQIEERIKSLSDRISGINTWIKNNPQVTEPNVYEIMDCNVQFAEIVAQLTAYYNEFGWPETTSELDEVSKGAKVADLPYIHPTLGGCYLGLYQMEKLREFPIHPFIQTEEANEIYAAVRMRQLSGTYALGTTEEDRRIKRELICKSMSVAYYIWQVKQTEPDYQYDNETEFNGMKEMFTLYQESETPCQFKEQISKMFSKIETDYKYREKAPQYKKD